MRRPRRSRRARRRFIAVVSAIASNKSRASGRGVGEAGNELLPGLLRNERHQCAPAVEVLQPVEYYVLFKRDLSHDVPPWLRDSGVLYQGLTGAQCGAGTCGGTVQGPGGGSGMAAVISTLPLTRGDRGSAISAVVQPPIELPVTVTSCSPSSSIGPLWSSASAGLPASRRGGVPPKPEWTGTSTHTWCVVASNSPDRVTG